MGWGCLGVAGGSGDPKTARMLVGGAVSLPRELLGTEHPRTGADN